ncbi:MAG: hypothetical protein ACOYMG_03590 [Candidatus Methylumidiphilus sp.]
MNTKNPDALVERSTTASRAAANRALENPVAIQRKEGIEAGDDLAHDRHTGARAAVSVAAAGSAPSAGRPGTKAVRLPIQAKPLAPPAQEEEGRLQAKPGMGDPSSVSPPVGQAISGSEPSVLQLEEKTKTTQPSEDSQKASATQTVTLRQGKRPPLAVVIGQLRFTRQAQSDVLTYGALLPSADQAHIGFQGDQLGYDPNYTDPTDPFRWSKLKDLIDSGQKILVQKVDLLGSIRVLFITPSFRQVIPDNLRSLGLTLPTESLYRSIYPNEKTMTLSPMADTHYVYYTTALGSPADSSMAHELFGHMWLALKGVPWIHPSKPADISARGTLTAQHGISDPFGNAYTGTVLDFIDHYVGSETGILASPTQNVGPQLLQRSLTAFKSGFVSGATGTVNGGQWRVLADANLQWEIISSNYALAPQAPAQPPTPGSSPTPTTAATPATITQAGIGQDLTAWYGTLNPDKQYVFIQFLGSVQFSLRRSQLASQLLKTLPHPKGVTP